VSTSPAKCARWTDVQPSTRSTHFQVKHIRRGPRPVVEEGCEFFVQPTSSSRHLHTLRTLGSATILPLFQPRRRWPCGSSQLVTRLGAEHKSATVRTIYILDDPATGLHFEDSPPHRSACNASSTPVTRARHRAQLRRDHYRRLAGSDVGPRRFGGYVGGNCVFSRWPSRGRGQGSRELQPYLSWQPVRGSTPARVAFGRSPGPSRAKRLSRAACSPPAYLYKSLMHRRSRRRSTPV